MKHIKKIGIIIIQLIAIALFIFSCQFFHVLYNSNSSFFLFFDIMVSRNSLLDIALLFSGLAFFLELSLVLWLTIIDRKEVIRVDKQENN